MYNNAMISTVSVGAGVAEVELIYHLLPPSASLELASEVYALTRYATLISSIAGLHERNKMVCSVNVIGVVEIEPSELMSILYIDAQAFVDMVISPQGTQLALVGVAHRVFDGENMRLVKKVVSPTVTIVATETLGGSVSEKHETTGSLNSSYTIGGEY